MESDRSSPASNCAPPSAAKIEDIDPDLLLGNGENGAFHTIGEVFIAFPRRNFADLNGDRGRKKGNER